MVTQTTLSIEISWWIAFAALGALIVGQLKLLLRLRSVGGGVRSICEATRSEPSHYLTIVVVDSVTGLLLALLVALLKPSASLLVRSFDVSPFVGWTIVGSLGPYIADKGFVTSLLKGRLSSILPGAAEAEKEVATQSWGLRREAVEEIRRALWNVVRRKVRAEFFRLRWCIEEGILLGGIDADYFIDDVDDYLREFGGMVSGSHVAAARIQLPPYRDRSADERVHLGRIVALAVALLRDEAWSVIENYCGKGVDPRHLSAEE